MGTLQFLHQPLLQMCLVLGGYQIDKKTTWSAALLGWTANAGYV